MRSSRSRSLWIALALAAIALMATAANAAAATKTVEGGELDWGVKASFREYIEDFAQEGRIEVGGGAATAEDGSYRFPVVSGSYDEETGVNEVQYAGSVNFFAYGGILDITIENPKVVLDGSGDGAVFAHVVAGGENLEELELVALDATGVTPVTGTKTLTWEGVGSAITAAAEPVFGNYPAGTAFDDVAFTDSWVPTPPLVPMTVTGGDLGWGVKASWREYIKTSAKFGSEAATELFGGATEAEDGTYVFPVVSGTYEPGKNEVQYAGGVHWTGYAESYGWLLDITLKDPKVVVEGEDGELYVDAVVRNETTHEIEDLGEIELVELDASGATTAKGAESFSWGAIKSTATENSVKVFGTHYPAGTAFDEVAFTDSFAPVVPPAEPGETVTPPATGGDTTAPATTTILAPTVTSPAKLKVGKANLKLGAGGVVTVATLACPVGGTACETTVPKRLAAKIGGKRYVLTVSAPKSIAAGKSAAIKVRLPKAAREALGVKKLGVKFQVSLEANGKTTKRAVKVTIAGKK